MCAATSSLQLRFHVYWERSSLKVHLDGMPGGTSSDFLPSCFLSRKQKRFRSRSWTRVSTPASVVQKDILFTHALLSFFGADADSCGVSDEGAATQHQEAYLPYEGRSPTAALRIRGCHRGETLFTRWCGTRMSMYRRQPDPHVTLITMYCTLRYDALITGYARLKCGSCSTSLALIELQRSHAMHTRVLPGL